jgi:putative nucleotidyltransferase with HDIG domain
MTDVPRVLIIDDEPEIVAFVCELLTQRGFDASGISDPREGMLVLQSFKPDVCILDFRMPYVSGSVLLDEIKKRDPSIEVVFLTAQDETSLAVDLMKRGAIDFLLKPVELNQLTLAVGRALEHRRLITENEAYRHRLEDLVREKTQALNEALKSLTNVHSATLDALSMALDFRDQSTSGHSRRVADLTAGAAAMIGIRGPALVQIEHGALLHDVGKLKIPDSILWKPGELDEDEWKMMRRHSEYGYEFLNSIEFLKAAADIVYSHHEKFDGTGYPRKLKSEQIPLGARLFAIVDAVDAMIYQRPYNTPMLYSDAGKEIRRCAGTQFDPALVDPTLEYLAEHLPANVR